MTTGKTTNPFFLEVLLQTGSDLILQADHYQDHQLKSLVEKAVEGNSRITLYCKDEDWALSTIRSLSELGRGHVTFHIQTDQGSDQF